MPSSVVASFHYNSANHVLTVVFTSGKVYLYSEVPASIYEEMKTSFSKGTYLNEKIKGNYSFTQKE